MMYIITCDNCRKSGNFNVEIHFTRENKECEKCRHDSSSPHVWHFCAFPCYVEWMTKNKVSELGFPCWGCPEHDMIESMGISQGLCHVCNGEKGIKGPGKPWVYVAPTFHGQPLRKGDS